MPVDGALNAPGLIAEVTNTVSFQATGEDQPRPFTSTLHLTLSFADQVVGSVPSIRIPAPPGPRNCGHANSGARPDANEPLKRTIARTIHRRMRPS